MSAIQERTATMPANPSPAHLCQKEAFVQEVSTELRVIMKDLQSRKFLEFRRKMRNHLEDLQLEYGQVWQNEEIWT